MEKKCWGWQLRNLFKQLQHVMLFAGSAVVAAFQKQPVAPAAGTSCVFEALLAAKGHGRVRDAAQRQCWTYCHCHCRFLVLAFLAHGSSVRSGQASAAQNPA